MKTSGQPVRSDILMRGKFARPAVALLLVLLAGIVLSGCASQDKEKPWERHKKKWYESDMDSGDRAFYHQFFFGN
jgi:hypothetical protein